MFDVCQSLADYGCSCLDSTGTIERADLEISMECIHREIQGIADVVVHGSCSIELNYVLFPFLQYQKWTVRHMNQAQ